MFAGRETELKRLNSLYENNKFECVVLHGRRRVGKTALIREFMKDKRAIYYSGLKTSPQENLQNLVRSINIYQKESAIDMNDANAFEDVFDDIYMIARSERVLLVIDDYQFLAQSSKTISELICRKIDQNLKYSRLMLVICGSSNTVMEKEILSLKSPFYGRRTAQIKLMPFSFDEVRQYYKNFTLYDTTILYAMTGGVPKYLELVNPGKPIEHNIERAFFNTSSFLFEEPMNILMHEVRDPTYYNAVLRAIAAGHSKNSEIASAVGLDTAACTAYLKNLIALGIVSKHTPTTEKAGKKTIYEIQDHMFSFWYHFIPQNISQLRMGMTAKIWRDIARDIPAYMDKVFKDISRNWLEQENTSGRLPINAVEFGRWWGVDPVDNKPAYMPIIAYSDDNNAIFGDSIWSEEPADAEDLESLINKSRLFSFKNKHYYLFSCSGFTRECAQQAKKHGVNLVTLE